jgi:hypothetical protein
MYVHCCCSYLECVDGLVSANGNITQKSVRDGGKDKAIVLGTVERSVHVRTLVIENRRKALQFMVREHVEAGAAIFTNE